MNERKKIVIVGGGITGLTTAYYWQQKINNEQLPYDIQLIEASSRLGGKIRTHKQDGFTIERGPDSFLGRKKPAVRLAESLGIENELVRNQTGQAYILVENTLHKMPKGSVMGVPTELSPFWNSTLLSRKGKLRVGLDFVLPRSNHVGDQSLGKFIRRRFGDELVENTIEPLLSGIYAGDIDEMSLLATFPDFFEAEQSYKSVITGLQKTRKKPTRQTGKATGQFYSFKNGLETFVNELKKALTTIDVSLNKSVTEVRRNNGAYEVVCQDEAIVADSVVVTTPHHVLSQMFPSYDFFQSFSDTPANSVANVAIAYDQLEMDKDLDGTGFVISRNSDYRITACTWTHKKWENTTPDGKALLRAYVGKPGDREVVQLSDEEIVDIVLQDIERSMGITAKPEFTIVTRWEHAMPQYTIGHKARIQHLRRQAEHYLPGVFFAGSSYEGVGIPDCIGQAEKIVEESSTFLTQ